MSEPAKQIPELEELVGTTLVGRYRLDALLGIGGMGAVFRAHHLQLKRDVAVKILHPQLGDNEEISKRFDREARAAARLDHPNIVSVTDYGTTKDGMKYMVMQLVSGPELATLLGQPVPPMRAIELGIQIFRGLEHAHANDVIHRDLKPENVIVTLDHDDDEVLKLVDFGIAKIVDEDDVEIAQPLTRLGLVFGTPHYMSPEQATGSKIDQRTDIYSAGVMIYQMLAGRLPFDHDDPVSLIRMQVSVDPPALPPNVPRPLVDVVMKLMAKARDDRYPDARAARKALTGAAEQIAAETGVPLPASYRDSRDQFGQTGAHPSLAALGYASGPHPIGQPTGHPTGVPTTLPPVGTGGITLESGRHLPPWAAAIFDRIPKRAWQIAAGVLGVLVIIAAWPSGDDEVEDGDASVDKSGTSGASKLPVDETGKPNLPSGDDESDEPSADSVAEPIDDSAGGAPGPAEATLIAIDQALTAKNDEQALRLIKPARDEFPEDPGLLWREGKALSMSRTTANKVTALERYGQAFEAKPTLIDDPDFYRELQDLLRNSKLRSQAIDLGVQKLGVAGHDFLLELVNVDDPTKVLGWVDRHRILNELGKYEEPTKLVDWKVNLARDLYQAANSPKPCTNFRDTVDKMGASKDAYYIEHLGNPKLTLPIPNPDDKDDTAVCADLQARLDAARTAVFEANPTEAAAFQATLDPPKKKKGKRGR
ncbi:serine/threonine-protein kinase [Nannocystaceae bacterium ST9]